MPVKFTCPRPLLVEALSAVSGVVPTRGIKEVLESVRIDASKGGLSFLATDLEVSMRWTIPAGESVSIAEEGVLLAPAKRLAAILHEIPDEPVTLSFGKGACTVKSASGQWRITAGNPEDFPAVEVPDAADGVEIDRVVLRDLVQRTAFAAARERMRYALNGVLLVVNGDDVQAVATDGKRLAHLAAKCRNPRRTEARAIIPTRALTHLVRILKDGDEPLRLSFQDSTAAAASGPAVVQARLVEGTFPNFQDVIPVNCPRKAVLDRTALEAGLRRASAVFAAASAPQGASVKMKFAEGEDLVVSASVPDVGEATVQVPCRYDGSTEEIGFNAAFVLEALAVIAAPEVTFEFTNRQSAARLSDGDRYTYVVMPVATE
jgi:DNA polymerase-3 subunit beta